MLTQVTDAIKSKQTINPRTVLGFYATVLGLLLTASVSAVLVLAQTDTHLGLIPWLLAFAAIVFLLLVAGVFVVTLVDPSKLMLTQVSGTEYAAIQQRTVIGDSNSGERLEITGRGSHNIITADAVVVPELAPLVEPEKELPS